MGFQTDFIMDNRIFYIQMMGLCKTAANELRQLGREGGASPEIFLSDVLGEVLKGVAKKEGLYGTTLRGIVQGMEGKVGGYRERLKNGEELAPEELMGAYSFFSMLANNCESCLRREFQ